MPLSPLFQNEHFAVFNKPAKTSFHQEDNEVGFFQTCKQALATDELYPVHRLDKITSGLMIVAKTAGAAAAFGKLFEQGQIEKYYLALSEKKPMKKQGSVIGDMVKARRGAWKLTRDVSNPAVTQFQSFFMDLSGDEHTELNGLRVFLLRPKTGKTHQIRVCMKSLGSPIAGDALYADTADSERFDRGYLHAFALRFSLFEQEYSFCAPANEGVYFQHEQCQAMQADWQQPWLLKWPRLYRD